LQSSTYLKVGFIQPSPGMIQLILKVILIQLFLKLPCIIYMVPIEVGVKSSILLSWLTTQFIWKRENLRENKILMSGFNKIAINKI